MPRIAIASPYPLVRAGLGALLSAAGDMEVVGSTASLADLAALVGAERPDLVLLEVESEEDEALATIARLAEEHPGLALLALGGYPSPALLGAVLAAGARGYLLRDATGEDLVGAVRAALQGFTLFHPAVVPALLDGLGGRRAPERASSGGEVLTPRELEVLQLMAEGLTNKAIARRMGISEHTVKFHVGAMLGKLGAASRAEAIAIAARQGLILV